MAETSENATYDKSKARNGYSTVQAIDPHDGKTWDVLVSGQLLDKVRKEGMGKCRELTDTVRWSLLNPSAVFRGLRDDQRNLDEDDWLCYVATPPRAYDYKRGTQVPCWDRQVVIVCVNEDRVVYNWWWVECDPENPRLPVGHRDRFREKVF